jgi:hypothetical protein
MVRNQDAHLGESRTYTALPQQCDPSSSKSHSSVRTHKSALPHYHFERSHAVCHATPPASCAPAIRPWPNSLSTRSRRVPILRHRFDEHPVRPVNMLLHLDGRLLVQRRIRVPLDLVLAGADIRDAQPPAARSSGSSPRATGPTSSNTAVSYIRHICLRQHPRSVAFRNVQVTPTTMHKARRD